MALIATNRTLIKQSLKTAVAGIVSLYAAKLLRLPENYWASISALIVMQSNVGATISASWTRLAGTAVGAVVGGILMAFWGANVMAFGAAVAISFYVCSVLKLAESQRLATVTVAILMLIGRANTPWIVALHRFLEVSIGILVAMLISVVLWPSRARESLRKGIAQTLTDIEAMYLTVSRSYRNGTAPQIDPLRARLDADQLNNQNLMVHANFERVLGTAQQEFLVLLMDHVARIYEAVVAIEVATRGSAGDTYYRNFEAELERFQIKTSVAIEWLSASVAAWRFDREWPDLAQPVKTLEDKASTLRATGVSRDYDLDELVRFYAFLLSSKNLSKELDLAHKLLLSRPRSALSLSYR